MFCFLLSPLSYLSLSPLPPSPLPLSILSPLSLSFPPPSLFYILSDKENPENPILKSSA